MCGSSICEHNRIRINCKECGGSSICEHNRIRINCIECGGSSICEHNRQRNGCKECGGSSICEHNRQRSKCLQCMTVETALKSGFVCKMCLNCYTRASICRSCSRELGFTEDVSFEAIVIETLCFFFGSGIKTNSRIFLGGYACADAIDGDLCESENDTPSKGAYTDMPLPTPKQRISIEIDENFHSQYPVTCELKRYDTLTYGADETKFPLQSAQLKRNQV